VVASAQGGGANRDGQRDDMTSGERCRSCWTVGAGALPFAEAGGQITIPTGAQRTVASPIVHRIDCPTGWAVGGAQVNYDSTGWSPVTESQVLWPDCQ
jgi:hypothetical protein